MELLVQPLPFPHLLAANVLSAESETTVLSKLSSLRWVDFTQSYYRFRISGDDKELDQIFELPEVRTMVRDVRQHLNGCMRWRLSTEAQLTAHRYDENAIIGFHTDYAGAREVRFVLNLNSGWSHSQGGIWVLSDRPDIPGAAFLPPLSNTGFAFETNANSFHALTRRSSRTSYALVVSFVVG